VKEAHQYYHHPENNRKIKDGWYNSYYKNGKYHEIGIYKDDERDGEWAYFTEDVKETKGIYKDGKKWSGKFWISVKLLSMGRANIFIEKDEEILDEDEIFRGLFTYARFTGRLRYYLLDEWE
jgi:hypothetical protein